MIISNSFEKGPETWCSYEYHASTVAGHPGHMEGRGRSGKRRLRVGGSIPLEL